MSRLDDVQKVGRRLAYRRSARSWARGAGDRRLKPWPEAVRQSSKSPGSCECNICGWVGPSFIGSKHSESALCPVCGSIARDRFLFWCWTKTSPYDATARVLETSPRLGELYRSRMRALVRYVASDFDESAHKASIRLDLQDMLVKDRSYDVILTPHVLEHVPDTAAAIGEMYRVLDSGGTLQLQVPVPQARTGVPASPEYHGDNTLVYFRFGWDLADRLRQAGFTCRTLITEELFSAVKSGINPWPTYDGDDCDVADLIQGGDAGDLTCIANHEESARHGFEPAFQFITFSCQKRP